jgi:hypothetical protein
VSHSGGTFPWTHPRLRLVDRRDDALLDKLVARLWADTLVFDPLHMPLLVDASVKATWFLGAITHSYRRNSMTRRRLSSLP